MADYLTVRQVATQCQVGEDCVRGWLKKDKLQRTKAGGRTLIDRADLDAFIRKPARAQKEAEVAR